MCKRRDAIADRILGGSLAECQRCREDQSMSFFRLNSLAIRAFAACKFGCLRNTTAAISGTAMLLGTKRRCTGPVAFLFIGKFFFNQSLRSPYLQSLHNLFYSSYFNERFQRPANPILIFASIFSNVYPGYK